MEIRAKPFQANHASDQQQAAPPEGDGSQPISRMNVHLYPSTLTHETRILKIVRSLRGLRIFDEIAVVGLYRPGLLAEERKAEGICFHRLAPLCNPGIAGTAGKVLRTVFWYFAVLLWFRRRRVDCINCHSLPLLPLCVFLKHWKKCSLVYDTHELETETAGSRGIRKRLSAHLERWLIRHTDAICVVGAAIADWYARAYAIRTPWIVRNVPYRTTTIPGRTGLLRQALGLSGAADAIVFLYQGVLGFGRGIETLVTAFASTSRGNSHLVFLGYGALEEYVKDASSRHRNIHFVPAVPPEKLNEYTVDADVGLSLIDNVCLSYYLCAPNKMYEYASCGVPPLVSNFPEMARFVGGLQCGWIIEPDVGSCRRFIESVSLEEIASKRLNALSARATFCWESEESVLLSMYQSIGLAPAR